MQFNMCKVCGKSFLIPYAHFCCCSITKKEIEDTRFIRTTQLCEDTMACVPFFIKKKYNAVIGISRAGLLPATILAEELHIPLYSLDIKNRKLINLGGGLRFFKNIQITDPDKRTLIVDDTAATGRTLNYIYEICDSLFPHRNYHTMVIYADNHVTNLDYVAVRYNMPHYLEWCIFNSFLLTNAAIVVDNILVKKDESNKYEIVRLPLKHKVFKFICMESNSKIYDLFKDVELECYDFVINPYSSNYKIGNNPGETEINFVINTLEKCRGLDFVIVYHEILAREIAKKLGISVLSFEANKVIGGNIFNENTTDSRLAYKEKQ